MSEHQPTSWSSFYFDLQVLTILFPAGLYYCFTRLTDHNIFIILYGVTSVYFAGVMVSVYYLVMDLVPEITWVSSFGIAVEKYLHGKLKTVLLHFLTVFDDFLKCIKPKLV